VSSRHIGSLVADFHRNLIQGGIYLYPLNAYTGKGKLRVLYECAPLAFVAERAGGAAISEQGRVLDLQAGDLHQRWGFVMGSAAEVAVVEKFMSEYGLLPPASP
jgi:fructose-1,6-bisphosphatase I